MPQTRLQLVAIYDKTGKLLSTEQAACEVSDGVLALEEVRRLDAELVGVDDAQLSLAQLAKMVRALARASGQGEVKMDLADMRALVRRDLRDEDPASYRWTDDELERHIAHALAELSEAAPDEQQATVATTAGSRDISLAGLAGLVMVQAVEYPLGYFPRRYQPFSLWAGTISLLGDALPYGGNAAVCYGRQHTLDDAGSTIPGYLEDLVAVGAEGYAGLAWAVFAANRVNSGGASVPDEFQRLGELRLDYFRSELARLGRRHRLRVAQLYRPAGGELSRTTDPGP